LVSGFGTGGQPPRYRSSIDVARRVVRLLEEMGHELLTRHLVEDRARTADRQIGPQDVYRRDMAGSGRLFISEASGSSFGLGFEAGYGSGEDKESDPALPPRTRRQIFLGSSQLRRGLSAGSHAPRCP
jgi:hypothetical protein